MANPSVKRFDYLHWVLSVCCFVFILFGIWGSAGCREPDDINVVELEVETVAAAMPAWYAAGLPQLDEECHLEAFEIRQYITQTEFLYACLTSVAHANACQIWDWTGPEVKPVRHPVAVVSPELRNGSVPDVVVHEFMHAALDCASFPVTHSCYGLGQDHNHTCKAVWGRAGVEGTAQADLWERLRLLEEQE